MQGVGNPWAFANAERADLIPGSTRLDHSCLKGLVASPWDGMGRGCTGAELHRQSWTSLGPLMDASILCVRALHHLHVLSLFLPFLFVSPGIPWVGRMHVFGILLVRMAQDRVQLPPLMDVSARVLQHTETHVATTWKPPHDDRGKAHVVRWNPCHWIHPKVERAMQRRLGT